MSLCLEKQNISKTCFWKFVTVIRDFQRLSHRRTSRVEKKSRNSRACPRNSWVNSKLCKWALNNWLVSTQAAEMKKHQRRSTLTGWCFYLMRSFASVVLPDVSCINTALKGFTSGWGHFLSSLFVSNWVSRAFSWLFLPTPSQITTLWHYILLFSKKSQMLI